MCQPGTPINRSVARDQADPVAALAVAGFATFETVRTWRADSLEDTCCT